MKVYAVAVCGKNTFAIIRWVVVVAWNPKEAEKMAGLSSGEEAWVYLVSEDAVRSPDWCPSYSVTALQGAQ